MTVDPLAEHAATWLLRWARARLEGRPTPPDLGPPPASIRAPEPAIVILTTFDGRTSAGFTGRGDTLLDAVTGAVDEAARTHPSARRLALDVVQSPPTAIARPGTDGAVPDPADADAWRRLTAFQDGLVVEHQGQTSWLVPTQILLQAMARRRRETDPPRPRDILAAAMGRLGLPSRAWREPTSRFWRLVTTAWIDDATQQRALPLVQGSIPVAGYDRERLLASARAGGDYLLRIQQADGSFTYTVNPWLATRSVTSNNIVRHAGTTAALFELAAATGDDRYFDGGQRGLDFLAGWYRPGAEGGLTYVLDLDGKGKLGALGLALLALTRKIEAHPTDEDREHALRIGRQIVAMQQPSGACDSYLPIRGDEKSGSVSLYYPGEAMLGLARAANLGIGVDAGFRAAAHRGADFLIVSRQGQRRLPPDAWLIQALEVLYDDDLKPSYLEHAVAIAYDMLLAQYSPDAPPLYAGGIGPEPIRSTRTTARMEGVIAAYRMATRANDGRAPAILAAVKRAVPHLLPMQYDADNGFYLDDPAAVAGGMRGGLDDAEIRIDYVQHHISTMLGLAALL